MSLVRLKANRLELSVVLSIGGALLLSACQDNSQSPPGRPEVPSEDSPEASNLAPLDLVYICGNKFLATNSTRSPVIVTYRVVGTNETGTLTLRESPGGDPGFSETELETVERGAVELYRNDDRVARRGNQGRSCGAAPPSFAVAALGNPASAGEWSAPFAWPNVAVHLTLLPTGKVFSFGLSGTPEVWDPGSGSFTSIPSPAVIFCSGHSFLPDGRLLISGGNNDPNVAANGIPDNTIFNPATLTFSRSSPMRRGRWYPTNTTLANGDVVILAGKDEAGVTVREPEVWSDGALRVLTTAGLSLPLYPRTFLAPNGKVFMAGESPSTRYLDPSGTGSWTTGPSRRYGAARDYGAAVMYDDGKILYVGGGRTTNTAETIDLNSTAPAWQWTGSMVYPRRHLNATVLPTGEVLVTGGTSGITFNDYRAPIHAAELWNPATGFWTTLASNTINRVYHSTSILLPDGRILHAGSGDAGPDQRSAELFSPPYLFKGPRPTITAAPSLVGYGIRFNVTTPDAANIAKVSLIRLGSTTHAFDMNQRLQWLSFTRGNGALSVLVPTSRNVTPPGHYMLFLLNGTGVPSVARIVKVGAATEPPPPPPPPSSISLAVTGRQDATTQIMTLTWTGGWGAMVDVYRNGPLIKTTENDGRYSNSRTFQGAATYTYKVCEAGTTTCSNEATVQFGGGGPPPNAPPVANFSASCSGLTCAFTDHSTDGDGTVTAWTWTFGDGTGSTDRNPSRTYAGDGSYSVTLTVTDDDGATNQKTATVTVGAAPSIALTVSGRSDATKQYMTLDWTGATGPNVDVYRNGPFLTATPNDGHYVNSRTFQGAITYTYKVCQTGTSTCSNEATVVFK